MSPLINSLAYYLCWYTLIAWQTPPYSWLAIGFVCVFAIAHFYYAKQKKAEFLYSIQITVIGTLIDSIFMLFNVYEFNSGQRFLIPIWLVLIWFNFSMLLSVSLRFLNGRWLLAGLLGGIFAPLSYHAGSVLGAVLFPNPLLAYFLLALVWTFALPCFVKKVPGY